MKKLMGTFINTILVLGLLLIVQVNKTLAAGTFNTAVEERIEIGEEDYYYYYYYYFIMQERGQYKIKTISGIDTFGYLYNEDYSEISRNDDDGTKTNFKISMELEANKKYYVKVRGFGSSTEGTIR